MNNNLIFCNKNLKQNMINYNKYFLKLLYKTDGINKIKCKIKHSIIWLIKTDYKLIIITEFWLRIYFTIKIDLVNEE